MGVDVHDPTLRGLNPAEALARWPARTPLAVWWSGQAGAEAGATTVLARPGAVVRGLAPPGARGSAGGWIGVIPYEAGGEVEPRVRTRHGAAWREGVWLRYDDAWVYEHARGAWARVGSPPELTGEGLRGFEARASCGVRSAEYQAWVARAVEYIRAGDVYQVNLAHRLEGGFAGSARAFFGAMQEGEPRCGAYVEWDEGGRRRAVVSASPELFLEHDARTGRVVTQPMKGTRAAGEGAYAALEGSGKDRAELAMIVDLMRNDLGRVCELGSVRVEVARAIERHAAGSLWQATAVVSGRLGAGRTLADLLRAGFPAGSVTGAPKVRAMQIIDELEPAARGAYCGSVGLVTDAGRSTLSVAIRTALVEGAAGGAGLDDIAAGRVSYCVGAGIVAESDPASEWQETLDKAGVFLRALERSTAGCAT